MSVVTVSIGGQSVPVSVSTYSFGDQSMSASVAAGLVTLAANLAAAQTAETNAETAETNAETAETNAEAAQAAAAASQTAAAASAVSAEASATSAGLSALASDYYAAATANVPRGIMSTSGLTAGSGGTDGTFALTYSGGNFSVNPTATFTVSGGALTAVTITGPGLYIGASPTAPTATFTNSAGLTGAAVTLVPDFVITSGNGYWTDHASDTTKIQHFRNVSGTATISTGVTLPKSQLTTFTDVWLEYLIPYTATGVGTITGGSGGTNGTFALAFSGGNFIINPTGTFTVSGGAVTAITLATAGRYVGSSPTAPTLVFTASAGLSGASAALTTALTPGTANNYILRPRRSDITLTGTATQYKFGWEAPFENIAGSYNVEICQYTGASFSGLVNVRAADGTSQVSVGDIPQYSQLTAVRNPSSGSGFPGAVNAWRFIEAPDKITAVQSKVVGSLSETPQSPSPIRPFRGIKVEANTIFCDVYPHADHYSGDEAHYHGDVDRFVLFDAGEATGIESLPTLNSHTPRRYDAPYSLWNHTVTGLDGGNPYNTGHSPSTVETVLNCGIQGGAAPELAGRGHGHETADAGGWSLVLTKNDASTGNVDSASSNLAAAPVNYRFEGDKLVSTWTGYMQTPGGTATNAFKTTYVHTFASTAPYSVNVQMTMDETDAGVTSNIVVRNGSYACMLPVRNATRMRGLKVTPSTGAVTEYGPIITVDLRDSSSVSLNTNLAGGAEQNWNAVEAWHHRRPLVRTRLVNNAGPGYTHWLGDKIDANRVARRGPWFVIMNDWGSKAYDHIFADTDSAGELVTGVLRTDFSIYAVFGDDPEA